MKAKIKGRYAAKMNMVRTVTFLLDETEEIHGDHKAFNKAYEDLGIVASAAVAVAQQKEVRSKAALAKATVLRDLAKTAVTVSGAIVACATAEENVELAAKMDYSKSDILKGREGAIVGRCRDIHATATQNLSSLPDYGVTGATLTTFKKQIDGYEAMLSKPRNDVTTQSAATKALPKLLAKADTILKKRLDKLVVQFETDHPEFVDRYRAARGIVSPGVKSAARDAAKTDLPKAA